MIILYKGGIEEKEGLFPFTIYTDLNHNSYRGPTPLYFRV